MVLAAKKAKTGKRGTVAAVVEESEDDGFLAVVGMSSSVVGDGTDSDSDEYVKPPLPQKHLFLHCFVDNPSGSEVRSNALIDDGCYTVLVKPEFADKLKLRRMLLRDKVMVSLAVDSGEVKKFEFDEYVHLKVYSVDHSWESKTIRATVAPGLCTNLILGLSFLASHSIVIDYEQRTITDKRCGKTLNRTQPIKPRSKPTAFEARKNLPKRGKIRQHQLALISQLRKAPAFLALKKTADLDGSTPKTRPEQFCLAVKTQIALLAHKDKFRDFDAEFKEMFRDRFSDLTHTDRLPTNVYHKLTMKDAQMKITCRGYTTLY